MDMNFQPDRKQMREYRRAQFTAGRTVFVKAQVRRTWLQDWVQPGTPAFQLYNEQYRREYPATHRFVAVQVTNASIVRLVGDQFVEVPDDAKTVEEVYLVDTQENYANSAINFADGFVSANMPERQVQLRAEVVDTSGKVPYPQILKPGEAPGTFTPCALEGELDGGFPVVLVFGTYELRNKGTKNIGFNGIILLDEPRYYNGNSVTQTLSAMGLTIQGPPIVHQSQAPAAPAVAQAQPEVPATQPTQPTMPAPQAMQPMAPQAQPQPQFQQAPQGAAQGFSAAPVAPVAQPQVTPQFQGQPVPQAPQADFAAAPGFVPQQQMDPAQAAQLAAMQAQAAAPTGAPSAFTPAVTEPPAQQAQAPQANNDPWGGAGSIPGINLG